MQACRHSESRTKGAMNLKIPRGRKTMRNRLPRVFVIVSVCLLIVSRAPSLSAQSGLAVFNVKNYGATGKKSDDAKPAIQKAIDACAKSGGGVVYLPPGEYTSGTLHLRSHVRFYIEAGATLYASEADGPYETDGLLFGEDLENVTIE